MNDRHDARRFSSKGSSAYTKHPALKIKIFFVFPLIAMLVINLPAGSRHLRPGIQAASTLTFVAEMDARVEESSPNTNRGTSGTLEVEASSGRSIESFLRFTVNGVSGTIQSARLRVYVTTDGTQDGPDAYAAGNNWTETGITWNNRPAPTNASLDNKGQLSRNTWVEYDVTILVVGNGIYSFVLAGDSSDDVKFSSREGSSPPQLVIAFNSGTKTPTVTALPSQTWTPTRTSTSTQPSAATFTPPPASSGFTFVPSADTYVDSSSPSANYGSLTTLRGDGSPVVSSYLRFDVQGLSGTATRATLRIFANSASSGGYEIRSVNDNAWTESTLTYNSAPTVGSSLGSSGSFNAGVWTSVDITPYIAGNGTYNLTLTVPGSTAISFASREAGNNAPQLVVEAQRATLPAPTGTATRIPGPTSSGSVVLVGAGDIASCSRSQDEQTAQLLDNIPGTVFTAGDNTYANGTYTEYLNCYEPTWGRHKSRTKPAPGNHDYLTSGAVGYFQYFNNLPSYYAYDLGSWRVYALNSEIDVSASSAQVAWLKNDLVVNPRQCVLAYWHKPRWSSGSEHGSNPAIQALWQTLYDAGAELVLNGHDHNYERFAEMNASGAIATQGLREFVVGTGGAGLYPFGTPLSASQVRNNTTYGVLKLTLHSAGYDWQFLPIAGSTFTDSGSGNCH